MLQLKKMLVNKNVCLFYLTKIFSRCYVHVCMCEASFLFTLSIKLEVIVNLTESAFKQINCLINVLNIPSNFNLTIRISTGADFV